MFATLSRRNTTLINQQLGLIEDLERDEEDPRRLESLFRLDHLASRMRRTAESLMVLADAPTPGADGADLTLADLLQAAIAGVRDYQRVQILSTPDGRIAGAAAPDVVHLLTELVDNALNYSPPTAPVMVEAVRTDDGRRGRDRRRRPRRVRPATSPASTPSSPPAARSTPRPPAGWASSWSAGWPAAGASRSASSSTSAAA